MAKPNAQVAEAGVEITPTAAPSVETNNAQLVSYDDKIKSLIKDGWRRKNNCKVRNVITTEKDTYTMVTFNIVPPIEGYVFDENTGDYVKGMTNNVFSSTYAVAGCMKESEDLGWLANNIIEKPKLANVLFNGGTIDVLTKEFNEGDTYVNPFGSGDETVFDHDTIVNLVVGINLGSNGKKMLDSIRGVVAANLFDM